MKVFCQVCYELEVDADDQADAVEIASHTPYHEWQVATDMQCCPREEDCSVEDEGLAE